jgi:hypothetical protein
MYDSDTRVYIDLPRRWRGKGCRNAWNSGLTCTHVPTNVRMYVRTYVRAGERNIFPRAIDYNLLPMRPSAMSPGA